MRVSKIVPVVLSALALLALSAGGAMATCTISGVGMTLSPGAASAGTYTAPTAPTSQAVSITVTGVYSTNATGGTCNGAVSFQRASLPPTMAGTGTATLPYTITSASGGGGNALLFTGNTVNLSNTAQFTFASAGANVTNRAFTATVTVFLLMQPNSPQAAGSYSDSLTAWVFDVPSGQGVFSRSFTTTGTVSKVCTIGGVAHPVADSATIPVSGAGAVTTTAINRSYASVACNTPSTLMLTSQSGGVRTAATPPSGFTNIINYASSATFSGATATLDTSVNPAATGSESGTGVSTTGTTPSGTLTVAITPQANALRLMAGSYADTLTITIVPQ